MKKIILLSLSFFSFFILIFFGFSSCKKNQQEVQSITETTLVSNVKYISALEGMDLKQEPNEKSATIDHIPFMGSVKTIEEKAEDVYLLKRHGKWTQVNWNDKKGWIFSGYLSNFNVTGLKGQVADYYRKYFSKKPDECKSKELMTMKDDDIEILQVIDKYIVLKVPGVCMQGGCGCMEVNTRVALWIYDETDKQIKKYYDIHDYNDQMDGGIYIFHLGYLNADKDLDIIIRSSYDGGEEIRWAFDLNKINYSDDQKISCNAEHEIGFNFDGCENTTLKCLKEDYKTEVNYKYNCSSNNFLPIE
jgi:hypothetical protein